MGLRDTYHEFRGRPGLSDPKLAEANPFAGMTPEQVGQRLREIHAELFDDDLPRGGLEFGGVMRRIIEFDAGMDLDPPSAEVA